jgi:hypothetical protein
MNTVYLVWAYDQYYPTGPRDLIGIFSNESDAEKCLSELGSYDHKKITVETVN